MPFASYRQYKFMMARYPKIAKRWIKEGFPIPKKPKGYKPGPKIRRSDLSSKTDPIAKKALKKIYK